MFTQFNLWLRNISGPIAIAAIAALWIYTRAESARNRVSHESHSAVHESAIVSLADDQFHLEAIVEQNGTLRLFTLGRDTTEVVETSEQLLTAYVSSEPGEAVAVQLRALPQSGDRSGRTSQFVGKLPPDVRRPIGISIPNLLLGNARHRAAIVLRDSTTDEVNKPRADVASSPSAESNPKD